MKRVLLSVLLVVVFAFCVIGCGEVNGDNLFVGEWKSKKGNLLVINDDGTWSEARKSSFINVGVVNTGKWVNNGDGTITMIVSGVYSSTETIADYEMVIHDNGETEKYLLWEGEKYYEVDD